MRPVNHPPQPGSMVYPTFRVTDIADLEADLEDYEWVTTSEIPSEYFDVVPVTALDALKRTLLELKLHPPPPRPKDEPEKKRRKKKVTLSDVGHYAELFRDRTYGEAREPLYDALGRYCSYCEQKVSETIAVEHVAPKANYPMTSVCWANFLLCCRTCNSTKDEKPARDVAWLAAATDEVDRYDKIRAHYLLPDDSTAAYTALMPALYANTGAGYQRIDDDVSVSNALVRTSKGNTGTKTPTAQVPFTTGALNARVQVRLVPSAPSLAVAQASFDALGFEKNGVGSSDDNRMWDRTNQWLEAVDEFRKLDVTTDFANQWSTVCRLAGSVGFFTTWIRVLQLRGGAVAPYPPAPAVRTSYLLPQFLQQLTQGQDAAYPNTDTTLLP
jgi:5-methylcytosine-specific restriction endonuclease McrA